MVKNNGIYSRDDAIQMQENRFSSQQNNKSKMSKSIPADNYASSYSMSTPLLRKPEEYGMKYQDTSLIALSIFFNSPVCPIVVIIKGKTWTFTKLTLHFLS